jgi:hypothetical protein
MDEKVEKKCNALVKVRRESTWKGEEIGYYFSDFQL